MKTVSFVLVSGQGSFKQPDFFFRANSNDFPSIVIESGWVESFPHLRADKDLWMQGNISVEVMILLGWKISEGRVKVSMEIWRRDGAGGLAVSEMAILPSADFVPSNGRIEFTKGQLFGSVMIAGQNPGTIPYLEMSRLREMAEEVLVKNIGMVPA
ncbi:hypothetical protein IFM58399_01436 [Aspergillus lentulus]|uniref:Uncharacterized protein n=1 Tax=Aspergillus lentulus TaxID=293939 RepID=A0AAN6BSQ5_ASPLE|nr:uncharacterized protein IFM58399_01436 [Aspergillus lentulus]KAF4156107.1 hypothetical protein CNMCM6069_007201 [Aspergillus lentulus]KAF4168928.1 hypothetical protein CNMCM6936_000339 [Aspergillus lentulus]KAF4182405.1 hypothetical protein CNMCM8060_006809 [Aspergillus lentulus]KAF4184849.1 hypothetical protein CNMCM7927_007476 [Aspergillus lentulus]KAF4199098.1 hypothetical protein CNMCM8694_006851 [Aspergillus lentulus]